MCLVWLAASCTVHAASEYLDVRFNPGGGANNPVNCIAVQTNGKVLIGGNFRVFNKKKQDYFTRLNSGGSLDQTFVPATGANARIYAFAVEPDGKVFVAGGYSYIGGATRSKIARLNTDGSLDATFNSPSEINSTVYSVVVQPDGKILIGGSFTYIYGVQRRYIARLNFDGSLDNTFSVPGLGIWQRTDDAVYSIALQPDGKILIGGQFFRIVSSDRSCVARLNADGSLDTTFDPGTGAAGRSAHYVTPYIRSVALQPDGKVLVAGDFNSFNGTTLNRILRLNPNGSVDNTFSAGLVTNYYGSSFIHGLALHPNGKILIGGRFVNLGNAVARLNSDGSVDGTFHMNGNEYVEFYSIAVQSDGKVVLGGYFTLVDGINRNHIMRLNADGSFDTTFIRREVALSWTNSASSLQSAPLVTGPYTNVTGAISPYAIPTVAPQQYFRLVTP